MAARQQIACTCILYCLLVCLTATLQAADVKDVEVTASQAQQAAVAASLVSTVGQTVQQPPLAPLTVTWNHTVEQASNVSQPRRLPVATVTLLTVAMAAASGLGALPFFFVTSLSKYWNGLANAIACGFMLAASFDLLHEGEPYGGGLVTLGVILGALFISTSHSVLEKYEDAQFEDLKGAGARKTLLIIGVMAAHAFGEGCGVGVSFCGDKGWKQGIMVTVAIGTHNIPESLAKAAVLVGQGVSAKRALWWSVLTCLPQPLVAIPAFLFVDTFRALLPTALGFACGCMVWIVASELLPDALEDAPAKDVATSVTLSAAALESVRMGLNALQQPDGSFRLPVQVDLAALGALMATSLLLLLLAAIVGAAVAMLPWLHSSMLSALGGLMLTTGLYGVLYPLLHGPVSPFVVPPAAAVAGTMCVILWQRKAHSMATQLGVSRVAWLQGDSGGPLPMWATKVSQDGGKANGHMRTQGTVIEANGSSHVTQRHQGASAPLTTHNNGISPGEQKKRRIGVRQHNPDAAAVAFSLALLLFHAVPEGLSLSVRLVDNEDPVLHAAASHGWGLLGRALAGALMTGALVDPPHGWPKIRQRLLLMLGSAVALAGVGLAVAVLGVFAGVGAGAGAGRAHWGICLGEVVASGMLIAGALGVLRPLNRTRQRSQAWSGWACGAVAGCLCMAMQYMCNLQH